MKWLRMPQRLRATPAAVFSVDTLDDIGRIAAHEFSVLDRHRRALAERLLVARRARDTGELLRNQFDLLPATAARIAENHRQRRALWRGFAERLNRPDANASG